MRRLFLAAGVAALAIAGPAMAGPGGGHGGGGGNPHGEGGGNPHGGGGGNPHGGGGGAPAFAGGGGDGGHGHGGGGGGPAPVFMGGGGGGHGHGGGGYAPMYAGGGGGQDRGHGGGFVAPQAFGGGGGHGHGGRAFQQQAFGGGGGHGHGGRAFQQQAFGGGGHGHGGGRAFQQQAFGGGGHGHRGFATSQMRAERQQGRAFHGQEQQQLARQQTRGLERQQARGIDRQQEQMAARQQLQANRAQVQQQAVANNVVNAEQAQAFRNAQTSFAANRTGGLIDGCPPGLWMKNNGCLPPGQAAKLLGTAVTAASSIAPLYALPQSLNYLYPETPDYYYRYGDGYLYQVDRGTNVIDALLPLIGGGYMPGQYLPQPYMASYVPDYYGLNSFYPDYGGLCNRYADGVIYQVDCDDGYVENVIPMYAGGYGVGQMLPSAYSYYNVPMQYRSLYYDTPDYGYWYAPGAIYQYDQNTSLITSVAALMSPGFTVGQQLPVGYDVYNVPYAYRATYYDTPNAWYRYNNGYIYQVDPVTQIVTAIVASLLT